MEQTSNPKSASLSWIAQSATGLLLVILLLLHMIANHFVVDGGLQNYQDVVNYLSNPFVFAIETTFLVVVTIHALLGVKAIFLDLGPSQSLEKRLNTTLTAIGVIVVVYSFWLTISIVRT